eukprot:TRINITY_DN28287_c0_g1_i1.p1 TRINITY_DN28287_c0_g1~~TRINITY_DN28287_c0_g1_i1.p1  ORF type:complete len:975 (-),score=194.11 TRINITY_DN28287_c0_g1_i1:281-3205(-)
MSVASTHQYMQSSLRNMDDDFDDFDLPFDTPDRPDTGDFGGCGPPMMPDFAGGLSEPQGMPVENFSKGGSFQLQGPPAFDSGRPDDMQLISIGANKGQGKMGFLNPCKGGGMCSGDLFNDGGFSQVSDGPPMIASQVPPPMPQSMHQPPPPMQSIRLFESMPMGSMPGKGYNGLPNRPMSGPSGPSGPCNFMSGPGPMSGDCGGQGSFVPAFDNPGGLAPPMDDLLPGPPKGGKGLSKKGGSDKGGKQGDRPKGGGPAGPKGAGPAGPKGGGPAGFKGGDKGQRKGKEGFARDSDFGGLFDSQSFKGMPTSGKGASRAAMQFRQGLLELDLGGCLGEDDGKSFKQKAFGGGKGGGKGAPLQGGGKAGGKPGGKGSPFQGGASQMGSFQDGLSRRPDVDTKGKGCKGGKKGSFSGGKDPQMRKPDSDMFARPFVDSKGKSSKGGKKGGFSGGKDLQMGKPDGDMFLRPFDVPDGCFGGGGFDLDMRSGRLPLDRQLRGQQMPELFEKGQMSSSSKGGCLAPGRINFDMFKLDGEAQCGSLRPQGMQQGGQGGFQLQGRSDGCFGGCGLHNSGPSMMRHQPPPLHQQPMSMTPPSMNSQQHSGMNFQPVSPNSPGPLSMMTMPQASHQGLMPGGMLDGMMAPEGPTWCGGGRGMPQGGFMGGQADAPKGGRPDNLGRGDMCGGGGLGGGCMGSSSFNLMDGGSQPVGGCLFPTDIQGRIAGGPGSSDGIRTPSEEDYLFDGGPPGSFGQPRGPPDVGVGSRGLAESLVQRFAAANQAPAPMTPTEDEMPMMDRATWAEFVPGNFSTVDGGMPMGCTGCAGSLGSKPPNSGPGSMQLDGSMPSMMGQGMNHGLDPSVNPGMSQGMGPGGCQSGDGAGGVPNGPVELYAQDFFGDWCDDRGNYVQVAPTPPAWQKGNATISACIVRHPRPDIYLPVKQEQDGRWICGNSVLDAETSHLSQLNWVRHDGLKSSWIRGAQ